MPKSKAKKPRLEESEKQETLVSSPTNTELVVSDSPWCPEFIQELLPSAERTALLYHLSFLSLGSFPKLERLIREQAIETQLLFGSSEAVLLKCVSTSSNLVTSLFPILKKAVEKNKPKLAVKYLEEAKTWIEDIISAVDDMVMSTTLRYEKQNQSVANCTSDVFQEQKETTEKLTRKSEEIRSQEDALVQLEMDLRKLVNDMKEIEKKIEEQNHKLQDHIRSSEQKKKLFGFFRAFVPFFGAIHEHDIAAKTKSINAALSHLNYEKRNLQNKEWNIKVSQTDLQLKLANSKIRLGAIPDPDHLQDVQQSLFQIQQILFSLKKFWEKVGAMLDMLKENTFTGEDLIDDLDDLEEEFLTSIEEAGKYWKTFGACCYRAQNIFSIQSKDAYEFLEINSSSLSEDERNKQYESIMEKLRKISPQGSSRAAITQ